MSPRRSPDAWVQAFLLGLGVAIVAPEQAFAGPKKTDCPPNRKIAGQCAINGFITNVGDPGGFAGAVLSNEGLNGIVQSSSYSLEAIRQRRLQESRKKCADGFERVGDQCRRRTGPITATEEPGELTSVRGIRPGPSAETPPNAAFTRAATEPTFAFWSIGFGDYERRSNLTPGAVEVISTGPPVFSPVNLQRTATTFGGLFGVDKTYRNVIAGDDGLIVGALAGYLHSNLSFEGSATTTTNATLDGPSVGGYLAYFSGGFSTDLTLRADLLALKENFSQLSPVYNPITDTITGFNLNSGTFSGRMTDFVVAGNVGYRHALAGDDSRWIEPTAGIKYVHVSYDDGAAALGLTSGNAVRLQGGARVGTDLIWRDVLITPSLTGLVYSDVSVSGFIAPNAQTFPIGVVPSDQGKVRGEGILGVNFAFGNGLSSYIVGEVRGGQDLIGAGGKGGLRYRW